MDFVSWTKIAKTIVISQLWSIGRFAWKGSSCLVVDVIGLVVIFVVLCSTTCDRKWRLLPREAGVDIINPVLKPTRNAGYSLSHSALTWSQRITGWIGVEQILVKVTGKSPLLYRLQGHGHALLYLKDESLPVFRP